MFTGNLLHMIRLSAFSVLSLAFATASASLKPLQVGDANDLSVVTVAQGQLKGEVVDAASQQKIENVVGGTLNGYRKFLGIPYAAPPLGNLRWRAPAPAPSWTGTRDATKFGAYCLQSQIMTLSPNLKYLLNGREDCLYLNVYTPIAGNLTNLPVIVWIHGGAYFIGAGQSFDPSVMAQKANVIVVTFNYRLGPLGYLYLPGLAAERRDGSSGNYGIMDQQAAFQWVKSNIIQFGGNPNNITIGGESAGAMSSCIQVLSPYAKGLFDKAIIESGSCNSPAFLVDVPQSLGLSETLINAVGCNKNTSNETIRCMRKKSAAALIKNSGDTLNFITGASVFGPVVDGAVIPQPAMEAIFQGNFNKVPVMMGNDHDEMNLLVMLSTLTQGQIQSDQYSGLIDTVASGNSNFASQILTDYPLENFATPGYAYSRVLTDNQWACATLLFTQALAQNSPAPVFTYEFNDPNPPGANVDPLFGPLGTFHSSELLYVFQNGGAWPYSNFPATFRQTSDAQKVLSGQMLSYWTNFARSGAPSDGGDISGNGSSSALPTWPQYVATSDNRMSLTSAGAGPQIITDFSEDHQCSFWEQASVYR